MFGILMALLIGYLFHELYWKRRNLPPGPTPFPLLGNLPELFGNPPGYDVLIKWRKQYGDIYTYWNGPQPVIAINGYESIKNTMVKDGESYADRVVFKDFMGEFRGGDYGIVDASGELWRSQRRFALHTLRDFGMGKNLMEQRVLTEVESFIDRVKKTGKVQPQDEFDLAVGSIMNNLLFGYRFDEERRDEFFRLKELSSRQMKEFGHWAIFFLLFVPSFKHVPYFKGHWNSMMHARDGLFGFFREQIKEMEKEINLDSTESTTIVEQFLKEHHTKKEEPENGGFSKLQLENLIFDLWVAGMETTSNTLTWAIVYLLNHPKEMEKIHEELDLHIERGRTITSDDKNKLPYLVATSNEVQRLGNIVPVNLFHATTQEVELNGYRIPKGTPIIPQISTALYDEQVFPQPYKFKPERFLNPDGTLRKVDELIPFSMGKRQCLGESLARMEIFLFLANVLHTFDITSDVPPSMEKKFGSTMEPTPFECTFTTRTI